MGVMGPKTNSPSSATRVEDEGEQSEMRQIDYSDPPAAGGAVGSLDSTEISRATNSSRSK
ncbi:hypothetical protein CCUG60884_02061 [Mycobacteroides salmoniphilum]|uniref:Uncharacterized protein n=1 Tax=Mycobacteroides salmoniphilum TaxID=404941 RepID=A0A4R8SX39_9MYCO|nr:hypothetical protein CCUG60884_02061 [Mycobacteroides salmoniphilum]